MRSRSSRSANSIVTLPRLAPICTPTRVSRRSASSCSSSSRPGGRRRVASVMPAPSTGSGAGFGDGAGAGTAPAARRRRCGPLLHRAHRPPLARRLAGQPLLQRAVGGAEQGAGVAGRQLPVGQQVLHRRRQAEQAQRVGDRRAALADPLGDVVVGELEVLDQLLVGRRLLERGEIRAVEVLDERLLDGAHVVGDADDRRDGRRGRRGGRPASGARRRSAGSAPPPGARGPAAARRSGRSTPPARRASPRRSAPAAGAGWRRCRPTGISTSVGPSPVADGGAAVDGRDQRAEPLTQPAAPSHRAPPWRRPGRRWRRGIGDRT